MCTFVRDFVVNFEDSEATGIASLKPRDEGMADAWYSIDGRRLQDKPTQRGIYINNGKKVIIK